MLLIEPRMIGDAVMSLPFIRAAMSRHPVHVSCTPATAPIYRRVLSADRIHPWHPPWIEAQGGTAPPRWTASGLGAHLAELRALSPSIAVSVWADPRVHFLMARSGAKTRVGFPINVRNYYAGHLPWRQRQLRWGPCLATAAAIAAGRPLLTNRLNRAMPDQHHVECWKQIAEALDLPWDEETPWFPPPEATLPHVLARSIQQARTDGRPVWALHGGARVPAQRWPLEHFMAMLREELVPAGALAILIDSPEVAWPDALRAEFHVARPASLDDLVTLLHACDGLLCNDTGVSHLAAALGKSVVTIFLASKPEWFGPRGARCRWIASSGCPLAPCMGRCLQPRLLCHDPDLRPQVRVALRNLIRPS
jgi:ADP-heptose:LPS heptosyltransferase